MNPIHVEVQLITVSNSVSVIVLYLFVKNRVSCSVGEVELGPSHVEIAKCLVSNRILGASRQSNLESIKSHIVSCPHH